MYDILARECEEITNKWLENNSVEDVSPETIIKKPNNKAIDPFTSIGVEGVCFWSKFNVISDFISDFGILQKLETNSSGSLCRFYIGFSPYRNLSDPFSRSYTNIISKITNYMIASGGFDINNIKVNMKTVDKNSILKRNGNNY